jgi:hypothetical protein
MGNKFFIPDAKDAAEAESVYEGIRKFHIEQMGASLSARRNVNTVKACATTLPTKFALRYASQVTID